MGAAMTTFDSATLNRAVAGQAIGRPPGHTEGKLSVAIDEVTADANDTDVLRILRLPAGSIIVDAILEIDAAAGTGVTGDFGYTYVDGASGSVTNAFLDDADIDGTLVHRKNIPGLVTLERDAFITVTIDNANFDAAKVVRATVLFIEP